MDLVTNAEVAASWPGFAKLPADEQAALITDASQAIEDYCRRSFGSGVVTEVRSGTNSSRLWLKNKPVSAILSVTINGTAHTNADGMDWQFVPATGELVRGVGHCDPRFGPWFPAGTNNIEIVYLYGYADVPGPVKRACLLTVRQLATLATQSGVYDSESIGDYSYTRGAGGLESIPATALMLLRNYVSDDII